LQCSEAEKSSIIAQRFCNLRFGGGLSTLAADTGNFNYRPVLRFFFRQLQHWFEQVELRVANRELRCVNANGYAACARRQIVAGEGPLPALVELALCI
jgi:hypothetical protein